MNNILLSKKQEDIQNKKYENANYWDMMNPKQGPDVIVKLLIEVLPKHSTVFEYGAGRGRNTLPLAIAGHSVIAQDIAKRPIDELTNIAESQFLDIRTYCTDAIKHILEGRYNAFVCIRVLHFMAKDQAWKTIENMKTHTLSGGYNALIIMISPTKFSPEYFCPSVEEIIENYSGWEIIE